MDVLKNFVFPKIVFKRDIIRAKIWFPSCKRWLANNMTGQADVRLYKLGGGWRLVKWMYQALFFPPRAKEAKKQKNLITPDLMLHWEGKGKHENGKNSVGFKCPNYFCLRL